MRSRGRREVPPVPPVPPVPAVCVERIVPAVTGAKDGLPPSSGDDGGVGGSKAADAAWSVQLDCGRRVEGMSCQVLNPFSAWTGIDGGGSEYIRGTARIRLLVAVDAAVPAVCAVAGKGGVKGMFAFVVVWPPGPPGPSRDLTFFRSSASVCSKLLLLYRVVLGFAEA